MIFKFILKATGNQNAGLKERRGDLHSEKMKLDSHTETEEETEELRELTVWQARCHFRAVSEAENASLEHTGDQGEK